MRHSVVTLFGAGLVWAVVSLSSAPAARTPADGARMRPVPAHPAAPLSSRQVIEQYCLTCHDDDKQKGELTLEAFDPEKADAHPEIAEKVVRKLRARMMPPPGEDRPADEALDAFATALEAKLDA